MSENLANTGDGDGEMREEIHENTAVLSLASPEALSQRALRGCSYHRRPESDLLDLNKFILSVPSMPKWKI